MLIEKTYLLLFVTVFLAELGDKTQLVTVLSAADGQKNPMAVFLAAGAALLLSTACGTLLGTVFAKYVTVLPLKLLSGIAFVALGLWSITQHFQKP